MSKLRVASAGNILEVSAQGQQLPEAVSRILEPHFQFHYVKHLFGKDRINPVTGFVQPVRKESRDLFLYDRYGRMVLPGGFKDKVIQLLHDYGFSIEVGEYPLPQELAARPDRYVEDPEEVRKNFTFRPRQEDCLMAILANKRGLIHAVTGFGKMVIIAMICMAYPRAKIHICTYSADLVVKIVQFLTKFFSAVGQVGAGKVEYGTRITVFTANSLHRSAKDADILLVDEAHLLLSDKTSAQLAQYRYSRNFALTASPKGRKDGTDVRMEALFGKTIFFIPYDEAVSLGLVVPIVVEWTDVVLESNPCLNRQGVTKERWGIWRNTERNKIIAAKANTFDPDEQVQILVKTVEHAVYLRRFLPDYTLVYNQVDLADRAAYLDKGWLTENDPVMTPEVKLALRQQFEAGTLKKVISTSTWATGIDPTQLVALIRADAAASEIMDTQGPGRVSRTHAASGKSVGIVCDFHDQFDPSYRRKAKARAKSYEGHGWEQNTVPLTTR